MHGWTGRILKIDLSSQKTEIIELYFKGYTFTEIETKTNHSELSVKRYLADFIQIASLLKQKFTLNQIRLIAQKSDRLVREYAQLYQYYSEKNNDRLIDLITPKTPDSNAKKKSSIPSSRGGENNE